MVLTCALCRLDVPINGTGAAVFSIISDDMANRRLRKVPVPSAHRREQKYSKGTSSPVADVLRGCE